MERVVTPGQRPIPLPIADRQVASSVVMEKDRDHDLARKAQGGDLAAFEELVRSYQRSLFAYLYRMCRNSSEAEEMAQAAFVRAWKGLSGFRHQSSFKTWLYRIATNLCINRRTRTRPTCELPENLVAPQRQEPDAVYAQQRREEVVRAALDRLPPDQRAALTLATYEDMSYKEIAAAIGKSERAVDSLLFRARRNIRKLLEPARRKGIV